MSSTEVDRKSTRRFVLDNLPVFLSAAYLVPVSGWMLAPGSIGSALALGGVLLGHLSAVGALRPLVLAGNVGTPRAERATRMLVATFLFVLSAYLSHVFLLALLDDVGVLATRMGYTRLAPGSLNVFLAYLGFWALILALLADRLAPWIRELLKIERLAFLLLGAWVLLHAIRGALATGWEEGGPDPLTAAGFAFAFSLASSLELDRWRGRIGRDPRASLVLTLLLVGVPALILAVLASVPGGESGVGPGSFLATGGPIPGPMLQSFRIASIDLFTWRPALALLDLALALGSLGICVYLAASIGAYFPAQRANLARVGWSAAVLALGGVLGANGMLDTVHLVPIIGAALLAPFLGLRAARELRLGRRRALAMGPWLALGLLLAATLAFTPLGLVEPPGSQPWPQNVTTAIWPLLLWLASTFLCLPFVRSSSLEQVRESLPHGREPEPEPQPQGRLG